MRQKGVLSVTVSQECLSQLTQFVDNECAQGWTTNRSQVVNNAILEYIARNKNRTSAIPSTYMPEKSTSKSE